MSNKYAKNKFPLTTSLSSDLIAWQPTWSPWFQRSTYQAHRRIKTEKPAKNFNWIQWCIRKSQEAMICFGSVFGRGGPSIGIVNYLSIQLSGTVEIKFIVQAHPLTALEASETCWCRSGSGVTLEHKRTLRNLFQRIDNLSCSPPAAKTWWKPLRATEPRRY